MYRFFLTDQTLDTGADVDLCTIRHQLWRVLRMQPGDTFLLLNGDGREYLTQLREIDDKSATGVVLQSSAATGEPAVNVILYQCVLKADKMEWVLQKGTELGISRFVPVVSERTIVRPAAKVVRKYGRWRTILREAAEQSCRGKLPDVSEPMTWSAAAETAAVDGSLHLMPWEDAQSASGLAHMVASCANVQMPKRVSLLIGPEGGIGDDEMQIALSSGWQLVTLGPRILRAETAALSAVSILMSALGEMG